MSDDDTRPVIAVTMGDAAGVGPEIIMKSFARGRLHETCRPLVVGDAARLEAAGRIVGAPLPVRRVRAPRKRATRQGRWTAWTSA